MSDIFSLWFINTDGRILRCHLCIFDGVFFLAPSGMTEEIKVCFPSIVPHFKFWQLILLPDSFCLWRSSFDVAGIGHHQAVNSKHCLLKTHTHTHCTKVIFRGGEITFACVLYPQLHISEFIFYKIELLFLASPNTHTHMHASHTHTSTDSQMQITQAWCNYCSFGKFYPFPTKNWPQTWSAFAKYLKKNLAGWISVFLL